MVTDIPYCTSLVCSMGVCRHLVHQTNPVVTRKQVGTYMGLHTKMANLGHNHQTCPSNIRRVYNFLIHQLFVI